MAISFPSNIKLNAKLPLDERQVVKDSTARLALKYAYPGLIVFEQDTQKLYLAGENSDGSLNWSELGGTTNLFLHGYYDQENDIFWKEELFINPYPRDINKIYKDLKSGLYYYLQDNKYTLMFKLASSSEYGVSKLYDTTGQNTDGSVTQKGLTDAINSITSVEDEVLKIKSDF